MSHEDALLGVEKTSAQHEFFKCLTMHRDIFHIKNNQLIIVFITYLTNIIIFNFMFESRNEKKSSS